MCHNEKRVPDEWQARQATQAILQVSSSKHNAKKITTRVRGPFHQSITAIEEAKCLWTPYTHLFFRDLISYCWCNPQPMNQWTNEPMNQWISERVRQDKVQRVTKNQLQDHQTPAGSSATAYRGGHCHQATQTNPQPPTGDARYGLSSLIFFSHSSLDSFLFTCTSSLSWHSPARSTLLFSSPVPSHYPNIYSHSSHSPWSYTCTSSALSLAQFFLTILAQFLHILF